MPNTRSRPTGSCRQAIDDNILRRFQTKFWAIQKQAWPVYWRAMDSCVLEFGNAATIDFCWRLGLICIPPRLWGKAATNIYTTSVSRTPRKRPTVRLKTRNTPRIMQAVDFVNRHCNQSNRRAEVVHQSSCEPVTRWRPCLVQSAASLPIAAVVNAKSSDTVAGIAKHSGGKPTDNAARAGRSRRPSRQ